jgi:tetratricopeptide (TPR) repeat protein
MKGSSPPLAQVKAFLASVKDSLSSPPDNAAVSPNAASKSPASFDSLFVALARIELMHRGVWVDSDGPAAVIDRLVSTAGKSVLDSGSSWPVPLLAASAGLAGRIAEEVILQQESTVNQSSNATLPSSSATSSSSSSSLPSLQSAMTRSQQVSDERFRLLLAVYNETTTRNTSTADVSSSWYILAQGYYLRAAYFQPDNPPMWKKIWDVIQQHEKTTNTFPTGQEYYAIQQLQRIAQSKGNSKRVMELQLPLVESYLALLTGTLQAPSTAFSATQTALINAFVIPYRPQPTLMATASTVDVNEVLQATGAALKDLETFIPSMVAEGTNPSDLQLQVLRLQFYMTREEVAIHQDALLEHKKAVNRASVEKETNKSVSSPPRLEAIQKQVRQDYLKSLTKKKAGSDAEISTRIDCDALITQAAVDLASILLTVASSAASSPSPPDLERAGWSWLHRAIQRQVDKIAMTSMAASRDDTEAMHIQWEALTRLFVQPILIHAQSVVKHMQTDKAEEEVGSERSKSFVSSYLSVISEENLGCLEMVFLLIPQAEWMYMSPSASESGNKQGQLQSFLFSSDEMVWSEEVLYYTLQHVQGMKQAAVAQAGNAIGTTPQVRALDQRILQLRHAHAATAARVFLYKSTDPVFVASSHLGQQAISQATLQMVSAAGSNELDVSARFGSVFLGFLASWNGLRTQNPWLFCRLSEARSMCGAAQREWEVARGSKCRSSNIVTVLESVYLKLGKADTEGPGFTGGMTGEALSLYKAVIEISDTADLSQLMRLVLQSHCKISISKLIVRDGAIDDTHTVETAESWTRGCVQQLSSVDTQNASLHLWRTPGAAQKTVQQMVSSSSQLVASVLVQMGRSAEAEQYLEDAVREAPLDASASFALGAYRLQRIYAATHESRSPDQLKAAQIQLLKAAKLDSTRADPFALLGYWYEDAGDAKRAIGCYSKALLLDPYNPVAGRGLSRLVRMDEMTKVLDNAINGISSQAGWAWRIIGLHKASEQGEDELAVVALLKALRCSDIDRHETDQLCSFYAAPKDSIRNTSSEKLEVVTELAHCYRRIGRYTASVRTYYTALEIAGETASYTLLCACATGELCAMVVLQLPFPFLVCSLACVFGWLISPLFLH